MATERRGPRKWLWALVVCLLVASAFPIAYTIRAAHGDPAPAAAAVRAERHPDGVSCLGRIQPEGEVIHVAAPYVLGRPPVVEAVYVKEGQIIRRGTLLAKLAGRQQLAAALDEARAETAVARRRLEQIQAGTKEADLSAQRAEIARLEANLENARAELHRYEILRRTDDVTESDLDARRTAASVAQRSAEQATHRLESLSQVPASDIHLADAQLQAAITGEQRAAAELELSDVRAPGDGQVLKLHAHSGEEIGPGGLLEMAALGHMVVVAEVYETDIDRVHPGQRAVISGDLLQQEITGQVVRLGNEVRPASVLPGDPASFADNRIIEVRIRLDRSDAVAGLIGGKVNVVIQP